MLLTDVPKEFDDCIEVVKRMLKDNVNESYGATLLALHFEKNL